VYSADGTASVPFPAEERIIVFYTISNHPPIFTGVLPWGIKRLEREVYYKPTFSAIVEHIIPDTILFLKHLA
jgi:hypothetical protein